MAETLPIDTHAAVVTFTRDSIEFAQRDVELDITGPLDVEPVTGLSSSGPAGGPFFPDTKDYTLTNTSETDQLFWRATASETWVLIDGGAMATGSLAPLSNTNITVSLSTPGLVELPTNQIHDAYVTIDDLTTGAATNRSVAVSVGLAPLTVEMATVPADDPQPDGPQHTYRIGIHEITNAEYLAFLNDAYLNMDNPRGAWMLYDTDSGDVYMHSAEIGTAGTDGAGNLLFDASDGGRISFDGAQYRVESGAEYEPVIGVSWHGAAKFCNWLTVRQGMDISERAYHEGADPADWYPITITDPSDWTVRDLGETERADLITVAGYRLPMDEGSTDASLHNEWY